MGIHNHFRKRKMEPQYNPPTGSTDRRKAKSVKFSANGCFNLDQEVMYQQILYGFLRSSLRKSTISWIVGGAGKLFAKFSFYTGCNLIFKYIFNEITKEVSKSESHACLTDLWLMSHSNEHLLCYNQRVDIAADGLPSRNINSLAIIHKFIWLKMLMNLTLYDDIWNCWKGIHSLNVNSPRNTKKYYMLWYSKQSLWSFLNFFYYISRCHKKRTFFFHYSLH